MNTRDDNLRQDGEIQALRTQVDGLKGDITELKEDIARRENQRLRWALAGLGAALLAIAGWAWAEIKHLVHLRVGD